MSVYEYIRKKLFLHKNKKIVELKDTDLLEMFKEEIANELSVKELEEKQNNNLKEGLLWKRIILK